MIGHLNKGTIVWILKIIIALTYNENHYFACEYNVNL